VNAGALVQRVRHADGGVLELRFGDGRGNVLSGLVMSALTEALHDDARDDSSVRLVLLTSPGRHFSFGASVEEHKKAQARQMLATFRTFVRAVSAHPVPVASVVQGRCLGGAFELALVSHFVFANSDAIFGCPEIKLGVFPPVLAAVGAAVLGAPTAQRLLLTGAELSAARAEQLGWITALLDPGLDATEQVLAWYGEHLAGLSPFSLRVATRATRDALGMDAGLGAPLEAAERRYLEELLPSHDGNEGIESFLEKRTPEWQNR
jgi:cyclohexa-1,5-dienecarbonyl-CoA hydratase